MANAQRRRAFWKPQRVSATNYPAASLKDARNDENEQATVDVDWRRRQEELGNGGKRDENSAAKKETREVLRGNRSTFGHANPQTAELCFCNNRNMVHFLFATIYLSSALPDRNAVLHHRCTTMNGTSTSSSSASDVTTSKIKCFFHDGTGFFPISA